jgi:hypothetical protein
MTIKSRILTGIVMMAASIVISKILKKRKSDNRKQKR